MNSVRESWKQIEAWLSANAPKIAGNLNPPASESEIGAAEKAFGFAMPEEWRELYRVHNGMNDTGNLGNLFCAMSFLPLEQVLAEFAESNTPVDEPMPVAAADRGICMEDMHHPKWIAFAHDGGSTLLRIDMSSGRGTRSRLGWLRQLLRIDKSSGGGGTEGQVIFTDHDTDTVILMAPSLSGFLEAFIADLYKGRYSLDKDAIENGDEFLACDPEIDVINWSSSPKWQHLEE